MIEAVIFDFGGVLLTDFYARRRLAEFDALLGWPAGTLYERLYSGAAWEAVSTGRCALEQFWQEAGAALAPRLPADFAGYRDSFCGERLDEGAVHLAWRLRSRYRIALLSNATILLPQSLQDPRLAGLFDVTVISALEGMRKPDPGIYELTCRRLGVRPAACVFVDDKVRNTDVAQALGMKAVTFTDAAAAAPELRGLGLAF